MDSSPLGLLAECLLPLKDEFTPLSAASSVHRVVINTFTANNVSQDLHPTVLGFCRVGVEVNDFAVVESDSEALFNEHVAFFLLSEGRATALTALASGIRLCQCPAVINNPLCIGQVDGCSRLTSGFVVSSELGSDELEVTATPVLHSG